MMKKLLSLVLAMFCLAAVFPIGASAASAAYPKVAAAETTPGISGVIDVHRKRHHPWDF